MESDLPVLRHRLGRDERYQLGPLEENWRLDRVPPESSDLGTEYPYREYPNIPPLPG
jgi:hypothetical protein